MKKRPIIAIVLLALSLLLLLSGCSASTEEASNTPQNIDVPEDVHPIVGTWESEQLEGTWTFRADGTATIAIEMMRGGYEYEDARYEINGNRLTVHFSWGAESPTFHIHENTMTIDNYVEFTRVG